MTQEHQYHGVAHLILQINKGMFSADANHAMNQIIEEMNNILLDSHSPSKGEIRIKLKFKLNRDGQVDITPDLSFKMPTSPQRTAIAYIGADGKLQKNDPDQPDLLNVEPLTTNRKVETV